MPPDPPRMNMLCMLSVLHTLSTYIHVCHTDTNQLGGGALALSAPGPLISLGSPAFTEGFLPNLSIHEKTKQTLCGGAFIGWLA